MVACSWNVRLKKKIENYVRLKKIENFCQNLLFLNIFPYQALKITENYKNTVQI